VALAQVARGEGGGSFQILFSFFLEGNDSFDEAKSDSDFSPCRQGMTNGGRLYRRLRGEINGNLS
jgi:hypothetical protein